MKITRKELKELIKEQVGLMVPPGSNMEEQQEKNFGNYSFGNYKGLSLRQIAKDIELGALKLLKRSWQDNDLESFQLSLQDIQSMFEVKRLLEAGQIPSALAKYRSLETGARDEFPPSMWKLSKLESNMKTK